MKTAPATERHPADEAGNSLRALRVAAAHCKACPLWKNATQTVFGEGPARPAIMLVGEQPGDREDIAGHPFVGPAGEVLRAALAQAGIARSSRYLTNAVKHFKFQRRGKRRMHKKPADAEVEACRRWLEREIELAAPPLVIALGATAARALLRRPTPVGAHRGRLIEFAPHTTLLITVHPSFLLRVPDAAKEAEYRRFVSDLGLAKGFGSRLA